MHLRATCSLLVLVGLLVARSAGAQTVPPIQADDWKFEIVYRKGGQAPFRGLVTEQTEQYVLMKVVYRKPGSPTFVIEDRIRREDIARIQLLDDKEKALLKARLDTLAKERQLLAAHLQLWKGDRIEIPPGDMLTLKPVPWGPDGNGKALAYESTYFRLVSNARADIVHLTAIELEQVFAAYLRCLPPREEISRRTTIVLVRSLTEYVEAVKARGHDILNPAFFDPAANEVVCGSDLERLNRDLEKVKEYHEKLRADLTVRRAELAKAYHPQSPPAELLRPIDEAAARIKQLEQKNSDIFRRSHRRLVHRLCHEAFHAYLVNSVFGDRKLRVPPWLDEGLAQAFETAPVEGGEFRVGLPDTERLARVQTALKKGDLVPLADLLRATPRQFQVAHAAERQASDRTYLCSWALAFYLSTEKQMLGSEALDTYVRALDRGVDPLDAFSTLVGQPLPQFEMEFHRYLKHLREDGKSVPAK